MTNTLIGYARCSTDKQDLTAQRRALIELGVPEHRICINHGLTGRNRDGPGFVQALPAVRAHETLVVPKLDRLTRSVPDPRASADELENSGVSLAPGKEVPRRHSALPHHSGRDAIRCTGMQKDDPAPVACGYRSVALSMTA